MMGQSFFIRVIITALWTGALGILMGIPFPAGIKQLTRINSGLIPYAWATNISASVVSSILAIMLAMSLGFNWVSQVASVCYVLAGISFSLLKPGSKITEE